MSSFTHPTGRVTLTVLDSDMKVKEVREFDNLVVTTGCELIASQFCDETMEKPSHMAIGTGTTAPKKADTALETEVKRKAFKTNASRVGATVTYQAEFGPTEGTGAITEVGIFNHATAGTMLNRATFPVVNKQASDTLIVSWSVSIN